MKLPARPDLARLRKRLQPRAALALTLTADGISVSVVRLRLDRDGHDVRTVRAVPVSAEDVFRHPEKAGAILGAALDAAGVREKRCAVCVPPGWVLTASADLPPVGAEDLRGYLELQAEREFPVALSELRLGHCPYTLPDRTRRATLAALPARRLEAVETMLAAAGGRRAVSVSLALGDTLVADNDSTPTLGFLAAPGRTEVVVTAGGGVAALRSLPGPAAEGVGHPHHAWAAAVGSQPGAAVRAVRRRPGGSGGAAAGNPRRPVAHGHRIVGGRTHFRVTGGKRRQRHRRARRDPAPPPGRSAVRVRGVAAAPAGNVL